MCIVAYFRAKTGAGNEMSFVLGKCRITLIKQLSNPRLGLQAALYSVRLRKLIVEEHDLLYDSVTHWTDAITVLQGLHSADRKPNVFFANRAAEILEAATIDEWKQIKGELNPSVIGTRGITVPTKLSVRDWLSGPPWLKEESEKWPIFLAAVSSVIEKHTQVARIANNSVVGDSPVDRNRFSSFSRCVRVIAYFIR